MSERPPTTEQDPTPSTPARTRETRPIRSARTTRRISRWRDHTEPLASHDEHLRLRRQVLGRYSLERRIGAGGFGVVWLAFDERLEREVAVKVIPRDTDDPVPGRAEREARVAARLNHPGIVALYELGADDDAVYLVSELVPGRTLAELHRAGALSDRDVARIGVALCDALAHAHERRVIHRDVKPQNVIVVAEPAAGAGFAKLADFGVAHLASGDPLTRTGDVVGTLAYMAPEQAEGQRVTTAADVYSLALTLYECWTGTNPVRGAGAASTARRLGTLLPSIRAERPDVPTGLAQAIDAALDPLPENRPALERLRAELAAAADGLSEAGGLVEPRTLQRVGLTPRMHERRRRLAAPEPTGAVQRAFAGLAAGALVEAALQLATHPPRESLAVAAGVAIAVALLPRLAWLVAAAGLIVWLTTPGVDLAGVALMALLAVVVVPLALPRAGRLWSVAAVAPLLGAIGLAPAFVALAALAGSWARRAGLAIAGFVWLVVAELVSDRRLLFGPPPGSRGAAAWQHSVGASATHALWPLLSSGALAPLLAWGGLAAVLPLLVRGRALWIDVAGAAAWAIALVVAQDALARPAFGARVSTASGGFVVAAVVAAGIAVAAAAVSARRAPENVPYVA